MITQTDATAAHQLCDIMFEYPRAVFGTTRITREADTLFTLCRKRERYRSVVDRCDTPMDALYIFIYCTPLTKNEAHYCFQKLVMLCIEKGGLDPGKAIDIRNRLYGRDYEMIEAVDPNSDQAVLSRDVSGLAS